MHPLLSHLEDIPIIGILRGCPPEHVDQTARAAMAAGIRVLEVTLDSEDALTAIASLASRTQHRGVIGAGTVRTVEEADAAVRAGAGFIVSPISVRAVIDRCRELEVPMLPGAATPTEIARAVRLGAAAVKVFPAEQVGGPGFLAAVAAPLGHPRLVPTGGVTAENARSYLDAGAIAIGAGGSLFPADALRRGDAALVADRARALVEAVT